MNAQLQPRVASWRRTEYAIYLPAPVDRWIGAAGQLVSRDAAVPFVTMTSATVTAFESCGLGPNDFRVEAI